MAVTLAQADAVMDLMLPTWALGLLIAPDAPIVKTKSGRAWRCDIARHRWHRSEVRAKQCAFSALPMVKVQG